MSEEDVMLLLKRELLIKFAFEDEEKCEISSTALDDARQNVNESTDLQKRNFYVQKDAIMKYRQENNVKLCHQEKVYLGETMALNDRVESMRRKISDLEKKLKEAEGDLYGERLRIQDLELQKKNMRSEKDKVVQNLECTGRAFDTALEWYQRCLGIHISTDVTDSQRCVVTFQKLDERIQQQERKLTVLKTSDCYVLSDGSRLNSAAELLNTICQERRKWLSA